MAQGKEIFRGGSRGPFCISTSTCQVVATNSSLARFHPERSSFHGNGGCDRNMEKEVMGGGEVGGVGRGPRPSHGVCDDHGV